MTEPHPPSLDASKQDAPTPQVLVSRLGLEDPRWRAQAEVELVNLGNAVVPALIAALQQHGNPTVRYHAAQALGRIGSDDAVGPLAHALGDAENHSAVANAAEKFLVSTFGRRAVPALMELARSNRSEVRPRSIRALGKIGASAGGVTGAELLFALSDADPAVRTQGVTAVASIEGQSAAPQLVAALADANEWVRNAAAEALVALKRADGRPLLRKIAEEDEDMYTRHWAEELLDQLDELERLGELVS